MSNRVGGVSWHNNQTSKQGITDRFKCKHCGRQYKQSWTKDTHENSCGGRF